MCLEREVLKQQHLDYVQPEADSQVLKIALNDESLSGWFGKVLEHQSKRQNAFCFDVTLANCSRSVDLMQAGKVAAAVSSRKDPVHGFKSYTLENATYLPVASPGFVEQYFSEGVSKESLCKAPCLRFCSNDTCAAEWTLLAFGEVLQLTQFKHPSMTSLIANCLNHQAWALAPAALVEAQLQSGELVKIVPNAPLERPLYWHVSSFLVDDIIHVTRSVIDAARG
jgi:LysR family transcriptional regulator (chromosome initiation inhibitor)